MIKKAIVTGVAAFGLAAFFFGRDAASYVATSVGWVKDSVKNCVPIEFEIQRARSMVEALLPDIRQNMHLIAKEEVEVERLARQIDENETRLAKDRAEIERLKTDLTSGRGAFRYAGRSYTSDEVRIDLANRFARYKTSDATLASLGDMLRAREQSLSAARGKLEGMLAAKRQLEVDLEHLDARLKMVEAAQTTSEYNFDDSRLARVKELTTELRTRLEVAEKMVHAEGAFHDEIPLDDTPPESVLDEITAYFARPAATTVADTDTSEVR